MIKQKRVVITAYNSITPLGRDIDTTWKNLMAKGSNFTRIRETGDPKISSYKGDEYVSYFNMPEDELKRESSPFVKTKSCALALQCIRQTLADANITEDYIGRETERIGTSIGVLSSNLTFLTDNIAKGLTDGFDSINRMTMMNVLNNVIQSVICVKHKIKGPMLCPATACSAGLSAIGEAYNAINLGYADTMIVGGVEETGTLLNFYGPKRLGALASGTNKKICCPFDISRDGIVLGEGTGFLILEEKENAEKRGATPIAEILGFGMTGDGYHMVKPLENGDGGYKAMKMAIDRSGLGLSSILKEGLILNAHATSTKVGDQAEAVALDRLLSASDNVNGKVKVTAFKGNLGHCFSAAGVIETLLGLQCFKNRKVPPINNLTQTDIQTKHLDLMTSEAPCTERYMLKNSFGFGGVNTSLLLKSLFA